MDGNTFINLMDRFDAYYRDLQNDPARQNELSELNKNLCGKPMAPERVKSLMTGKMGVEPEKAEAVYSQLRTPHVRSAERVQVDAMKPVPPRPNIFKRWFSGLNAQWREENERYNNYVREQQTERLRQRKAMEETLDTVPENWDQGYKTLDEYLKNLSKMANSAEKKYDRHIAYAKAVTSINYAMINGAENLSESMVSPDLIDESRAMKDPMFTYLLNNREQDLQQAMAGNDPSAEIVDMFGKVGRDFMMNEKYDPIAGVKVFNAVQAYANEKSDVPSSDLGKESLKLAYDSLKSVLPEKTASTLVKPMEQKITRLQNAMQPRMEEASKEHSGVER